MLHSLSKTKDRKVAKRVGRSGKRGTTSGRGQKGQKSRSGRRIRPAIRDLISRIPKHRGFRNKPKSDKPAVVNLAKLTAALQRAPEIARAAITMAALKSLKLLPRRTQGEVKILGGGVVPMSFTVKGIAVSKTSREAIEKAGGKVEA